MHTCSEINPSNVRESHPIQNVDDLKYYLQVAIQLEHATLPPYLTALYSIQDDAENCNKPSADILRAVLVEEMLHMTLAANLLNAIDGQPELTQPRFVPDYPTPLPTGEDDFEVGLNAFSCSTIDTFLKIERPAPTPEKLTPHGILRLGSGPHQVHYLRHTNLGDKPRARRAGSILPKVRQSNGEELYFWSIGEFYQAIGQGFKILAQNLSEAKLFRGDFNRQVDAGLYFSGGGKIVKVSNLQTALDAVELIKEQGEGASGRIYDKQEHELSHYYRFDQIRQRRYYRVRDDNPDEPQGPKFDVFWDKVFPLLPNAKLACYPEGSELRRAAEDFNSGYAQFLAFIEEAFNGKPAMLQDSYACMFRVKDAATRLIRHPFEHNGFTGNAAPTFEIPGKGH